MLTMLRNACVVPLAISLASCGGGGFPDYTGGADVTCAGEDLAETYADFTFAFQDGVSKCMRANTKTYRANSLAEANQCAKDEFPTQTAVLQKDVCTILYERTVETGANSSCTPVQTLNISSGGRSAFDNQKSCDRALIANCAQGNCLWSDLTSAFVLQTLPNSCTPVATDGSVISNAC